MDVGNTWSMHDVVKCQACFSFEGQASFARFDRSVAGYDCNGHLDMSAKAE